MDPLSLLLALAPLGVKLAGYIADAAKAAKANDAAAAARIAKLAKETLAEMNATMAALPGDFAAHEAEAEKILEERFGKPLDAPPEG